MTSLLQEYPDRHAEQRPEAPAIVMGTERVSYGELARASNRLARLLRESGCQPGDRICFLMPKSPLAIITMLAVLKADCIYVPLDPASPAARLRRVVRASQPRWILAVGPVLQTVAELLASLPANQRPQLGWLEDASRVAPEFELRFTLDDVKTFSEEPVTSSRDSADPAHILFTSGSTGEPKGVVITHANVTSFLDWSLPYFGLSESDRMSGHSPLHFDLSTFDVFGTFAAGGSLFPVPPELNLMPLMLANFIRTSQLTQWFSVPSILNYMAKFDIIAQGDFPELKRILWCGEVFPTPQLMYWMERLPHVVFTNLYGPTEATIASSYYTLPECPASENQAIPIGRACTGEELLVLDDELQPVPRGEIGDLYIGGAGLSPGYWRDPETSAAAFRRHPDDPDTRIYRTGDLASVGEHQLVFFHGRTDSQIKSRGYRIELGEIETAVHAVDHIQESAVVAIETSGFDGRSIGCAFARVRGTDVTPVIIRSALTASLPSYMLPSRWLELERLPKNSNGKIDRPALRQMFRDQA